MDNLNTKNKRLLIVSYFYPPHVQATPYPTSSWVKYLLGLGWEIVILTSHSSSDTVCFEQGGCCIYRVPDRQLFGRLVHLRDSISSSSISARIINFFLQNFLLFPDSKRGWCKGAVKAGLSIIEKHDIKVILGVGTPWSDHLIASSLSKKTGVPWVADYRDAWTQKTYLKRSVKWFIRDVVSRIIELNVCRTAEKIIHASNIWAEQLRRMFKKKEIVVIPNGYDPDLFEKVRDVSPDKEKFTLAYIGYIHFIQKVDIFLKGFEYFIMENKIKPEHCQLMFGEHPNIESMCQNFIVARKYLNVLERVPIERAVEYMRKAHVLLLFMSDLRGWYPTKVFEYLAANRPILATPHDNGVISQLLERTGAGVSLNTPEEVRDWLNIAYGEFQKGGSLSLQSNRPAIEEFSRENLTKQLDKILTAVIT